MTTPLKINRDVVHSLNTSGILTYTSERRVNMTDNPYFPSLTPSLIGMKLLEDNFREANALAKQVRSVLNTQARADAYKALIEGHMSWIEGIEATPDLTRDQILTSGYTPYADRTEATVPPPAEKPTYSTTANTGEIILRAKPYKQNSHKVFYNWKMSDDQGANWQNLITVGTSSRRKVSELELYKEYWFKVAYATTAGEGEASELISVVLTNDSRNAMKVKSKAAKKEL